jgi:hypothetical protein
MKIGCGSKRSFAANKKSQMKMYARFASRIIRKTQTAAQSPN